MMKKILSTVLLSLVFGIGSLIAQTSKPQQRLFQLSTVYMTKNVNLHFISPEPIQFVDLSTEKLVGDLPADNIARVKINSDDKETFKKEENLGVITVVGQSFMAQYKVEYADFEQVSAQTNIQIQPEDMQPLEFPKIDYSLSELKDFCGDIYKLRIDKEIRREKDNDLEIKLRNVYVLEDYIFLDIEMKNHSNIKLNMEELRFSIEDKKIYSATHNQSIEIAPIFKYSERNSFRKNYRNIFIFKKFTFPNAKVLKIRCMENPISGRSLELKVKYSDILEADTF